MRCQLNNYVLRIYRYGVSFLPTRHFDMLLLVLFDFVRGLLDHPLEEVEGVAPAGMVVVQRADVMT